MQFQLENIKYLLYLSMSLRGFHYMVKEEKKIGSQNIPGIRKQKLSSTIHKTS